MLANQSAVAHFGAQGSEAAPVTAMVMAAGCAAPQIRCRVRKAKASTETAFGRRFVFVAVHRPSGQPWRRDRCRGGRAGAVPGPGGGSGSRRR
ncbi:hypothetical protein [Streptomyces sp. NPDC051704]|uniref:hypothetical protein n=1 Tax=Streptomyces sp. NPDC051704 TaxID=3365671 RepID=UPI00378A8055